MFATSFSLAYGEYSFATCVAAVPPTDAINSLLVTNVAVSHVPSRPFTTFLLNFSAPTTLSINHYSLEGVKISTTT